MAYEIVERLEKLGRKDLLKLMSDSVNPSERERNKKHEVFEDSFDCKEILTGNFEDRKWKLVEDYLDNKCSGAGIYDLGEKPKCTLFNYADEISALCPRLKVDRK